MGFASCGWCIAYMLRGFSEQTVEDQLLSSQEALLTPIPPSPCSLTPSPHPWHPPPPPPAPAPQSVTSSVQAWRTPHSIWCTMKPQGTLQWCPTALLELPGCAWCMLPPSLRSPLLPPLAFMQPLAYSMRYQNDPWISPGVNLHFI